MDSVEWRYGINAKRVMCLTRMRAHASVFVAACLH